MTNRGRADGRFSGGWSGVHDPRPCMTRYRMALILAGAFAVIAPASASGQLTDDPPPPVEGIGYASLGKIKQASGLICGPTQGPGSDASNVNTDCDDVAPHNETTIAVNPTDPDNLIGGANDYQFLLTDGGALKITALSRAHVSFDGGASWAMYAVPFKNYALTGDPAVAFDTNGTAYYATLGGAFSQANSPQPNGDVVVSHSADGGKTWSVPSLVAQGVGSHIGATKAREDKPYVTGWGDGNALVAWTNVIQGPGGSIVGLRVYDAVTHDGGVTWSKQTLVSSTADFCIGNPGEPHACDDFGAVPIYSGGHVYIAFANSSAADGHNQYLVSEVNPHTGALLAGPFQVAQLVDGTNAYPRSAFGRQTYQDSQFRTWSLGNLAADTTNANHLAVVWSDMRNSTVPLPNLNPYEVATNSDVVVSQSFDAGRTWSAPVALAVPNDQFMPWGAYDSSGLLRVGYFDRSYDPANHRFGYSLATETGSGSLNFTSSQLTTQLSDPTMNNLWNSFIPVDPDFPRATQFLGDYSGIAADPRGGVVALWTDLRNVATFGSSTGFGEDVFLGRSG
jgi:hypothetical protein